MQPSHGTSSQEAILPLAHFDALKRRYQTMSLQDRATAMLEDAEPALKAADEVLKNLGHHPQIKATIAELRKNDDLIHKMRPSEARNMLMDNHTDFIKVTRKKLKAWKETLQRLARGESIFDEDDGEYIPSHLPVASAYSCISTTSHYLSIVQLLLMQLEKIDSQQEEALHFQLVKIRRCSTVLSDCESASDIYSHIH